MKSLIIRVKRWPRRGARVRGGSGGSTERGIIQKKTLGSQESFVFVCKTDCISAALGRVVHLNSLPSSPACTTPHPPNPTPSSAGCGSVDVIDNVTHSLCSLKRVVFVRRIINASSAAAPV